MARLGKYLTVCLVVLLVVTSTAQLTVNAQTIPKPSIPEFTVSYVDLSYDVPTTTSINQYTGQTETHQGYHVENETIQLKIRNQPFTSYIENGQNISFYFNVREKGSFSTQWIELYSPGNGYPTQSRTEYTTITFVLGNSSRFGFTPANSKIDFQVQALIGAVHRGYNASATNQLEMFPWVFDGQTSEWSNTQTVTIPDSSSSVTPAPSSTNSQSSTTPTLPPDTISYDSSTILYSIVVATLAVSVISLLLYVRHLKKINAVKK